MKDDNGWMTRMSAHNALEQFVDFLVFEDNPAKCVAIRIKSTGKEIKDGDPRLKDILGDSFADLQEACFYDFGKDMAESVNSS